MNFYIISYLTLMLVILNLSAWTARYTRDNAVGMFLALVVSIDILLFLGCLFAVFNWLTSFTLDQVIHWLETNTF